MNNSKINIIKISSKFYKFDLGIDNVEKLNKIYLLIYLATLSGFSGIDVEAKEEIIKIAKEAIKDAKQKSEELNIDLNPIPLLCTSIEMNSISNLDDQRIKENFEFLKDVAIDIIDIHFNEITFLGNMKKIDLVCNLFKDKIISVNLSRKRLSNIHMVDLLEKCYAYSKRNLVIEIEGMKFYDQNFSHILQTVSSTDIINKQFIETSPRYKKIPIIFGNCKNRNIEQFALKCNVPFDGISLNYQCINNFLNNSSSFYSNEDIKLFLSQIKLNLFS